MLPDSKVLSLVFYKNDWHQREACAGCRRDEEHWSPQPGNSRKQPAAGRRIWSGDPIRAEILKVRGVSVPYRS